LFLVARSSFLVVRIRLCEDLYEEADFGLVLLQTRKHRYEYAYENAL
jgi:hypothetical protein